MIKFKIFTECVIDTQDCRAVNLYSLESRVNKFLDAHEVIDVQKDMTTDKIKSWPTIRLSRIITYIIKYKEV